MFQTKFVEEIKTCLWAITFCFQIHALYMIMWRHIVKPCRPQMIIRRMRIVSWITKATNTLSEYVILVAIPLQQRLHERASALRYAHIARLVTVQIELSGMPISCYRASYNDKWEHQLDATFKYIFHLKLVSTCFGRDIAYHQEITQLYISAYGNRPFKAWKDGIVEIK